MVDATARVAHSRGHKKKQRTRSQLIAAAIDVIATQGELFSIGDITDRAGVSHGTFYNYFTDRDALLAAVIPEVLTAFTVRSAALVRDVDPAVRFASITAMALQRSLTAPEATRLLLRLDAMQRAIVESPTMDPLRRDLMAGFESGRFLVGPDAATLDVVVGTLLFAGRRLLDEALTDDYRVGVVAQLLRSLGVMADEAKQLAAQAVAGAR
ncbi:MAG: TetR/AcrR family transcriptional regulator [Acidimicrobiales bacterium]